MRKLNDKTVLCFGDSNTWGAIPNKYGRYGIHQRWPSRLAELLSAERESLKAGSKWEVIEAGLPGRTTMFDDPVEGDKNGLKHLPIWLQTYVPDMVLILLGTNDLKHRFHCSPMDISLGAANLAKMALEFRHPSKRHAPEVLLMAPPPIFEVGFYADMFQGGEEKSKKFDDYFSKRAKELSCQYFNVGSVVSSCKKEGIHWKMDAHLKLADALSSIISQNSW